MNAVRQWQGIYQAVVVRNDDPTGKQRVTLRIPQVLGTAVSQWAAPTMTASGASAPSAGTVVAALFLGGDINHPVYLPAPGNTFTAGDASIVISGSTIETGTLDEIASLHPPAANWANNSKKITSLANGTASTDAAAFGQILSKVAATSTAGSALQNGTPTFFSWTSPNDGNPHRIFVVATLNVASALTGGLVQFSYVNPAGTSASPTLFAAGEGSGSKHLIDGTIIGPNTTVDVFQGSAMAAGSATLWAELWAA